MKEFLIEFLPGTGVREYCFVSYWAEFPRNHSGKCAFCAGDPCCETSSEDTPIGRYYKAQGNLFETCPVCEGRAS